MGGNTIVLFEVQTKQYFGPSLLTMGFLRQTRHHAIDRAVWKRHPSSYPEAGADVVNGANLLTYVVERESVRVVGPQPQ
jgi:hypothetical protein